MSQKTVEQRIRTVSHQYRDIALDRLSEKLHWAHPPVEPLRQCIEEALTVGYEMGYNDHAQQEKQRSEQMRQIRAKFFVRSLTYLHNGNADADQAAEVVLSPVFGDSDENKSFSKYTPQGELKMLITNPDAVDIFAPGHEYYIDITEA